MNKRRILGIGILVLIILMVMYFIYMLFDTQRVMNEINKAICDENYSSKEPDAKYYLWMRPEGGERIVSPVHRYFTWCWNGKGKIWMYCKYEITLPDQEIINPSYPVIDIEKKNGKWIITAWHDGA